MKWLWSIIVALAAALFYTEEKKKDAEAIVANNNVKDQAIKIDEQVAQNTGEIAAQEAEQVALKEKANEANNQSDADFFNSRK